MPENETCPSIERMKSRYLRTEADLLECVKRLRSEEKTIVTTNGCFDILHRGHLHILSSAAAEGDILIVGLNSDQSVRANKGPSRPINPEDERAEVLLALEYVDYVALFHEKECIDFVKRVRPDVHVNDASYGENCVESAAVREGGGRLKLVEKIPVESTTELVRRMKAGPRC
jgi:rfaE bifunctional protein nucleotidyltransferase chain/domain